MHNRRALWALVVFGCLALLIAPALWNGFPLLQYDTGGYLTPWLEHKIEINRSVAYGLLLVAGQWPDFWPVLIVQSALTIWVLALTLRAHGFGDRPRLLLAIVAALCALTTLPWLTAILLTDIFAGLSVFALFLLLLRDDALTRRERIGLIALVVFSAATHSATLAVLMALTVAAAIVWLIDRNRIPLARLTRAALALALSVGLVLAADLAVTGRAVWTPGGPALSFGRMLQDGIVKKYLDDHCPDATLRLCPYKGQLPRVADDFFWGGSVFDTLGRFAGLDDEMRRIVFGSLVDYPVLQLKSALTETGEQLLSVQTGAGVVNWIWNTYDTIKADVPAAVPAMKAARQQRTGIDFTAVNRLQVPLAYLAMALLPVIALLALRRKGFADIGELAATAALALLANAAVFGTLATAHHRYGARMIWIAAFVVALAAVRVLEGRGALNETPALPA
jgi:hypothetical protein